MYIWDIGKASLLCVSGHEQAENLSYSPWMSTLNTGMVYLRNAFLNVESNCLFDCLYTSIACMRMVFLHCASVNVPLSLVYPPTYNYILCMRRVFLRYGISRAALSCFSWNTHSCNRDTRMVFLPYVFCNARVANALNCTWSCILCSRNVSPTGLLEKN